MYVGTRTGLRPNGGSSSSGFSLLDAQRARTAARFPASKSSLGEYSTRSTIRVGQLAWADLVRATPPASDSRPFGWPWVAVRAARRNRHALDTARFEQLGPRPCEQRVSVVDQVSVSPTDVFAGESQHESAQFERLALPAQAARHRAIEPLRGKLAKPLQDCRRAWVRIVRQLQFATALSFAVAAAAMMSLFGGLSWSPLRWVTIVTLLLSLAARILIRCPRCRALWPSGSDADGLRKRCSRCGLRWGQEDNLPDTPSTNADAI